MKQYTWATVALYSACAASVMGASGIVAAQSVQSVTAATAQTPAQQPASAAVQNKPVQLGDATRKLLELQASGVLAADKQYPVSVDVAARIYQRYLDSFSHPIAEKTDSTLED